MRNVLKAARTFVHDDSGMMTTYGMFVTVGMLIAGGYAIDLSNVMTARTQLQVTVDSTAHAALVTRELKSEAEAKAKALEIAEANMPKALYGNVIDDRSIEFGSWNAVSQTFVPEPDARGAVRVRVARNAARENAVPTYLLKLVGLNSWNLTREAVLISYNPACLREGFVAEQVVDLQSNNVYVNGFCIHSNQYVKLSSGNFFEKGVTVSMPNKDTVQLPNSGLASNIGLEDALKNNRMHLRILNRLDELRKGLTDPDSPYFKPYLTSDATWNIGPQRIAATTIQPGRIYTKTCGGGGTLTIDSGVTVRKAVIITNCRVAFGQGAALEDVVILTTNTDKRSFSGPNGVRLGVNDNCAPGGGAQLVSYGGMDFASGLEVYGSQLIAGGDIAFSASSSGIQGASFVAGGTISGTSNMTMGFCNRGMEANLLSAYFQMVL